MPQLLVGQATLHGSAQPPEEDSRQGIVKPDAGGGPRPDNLSYGAVIALDDPAVTGRRALYARYELIFGARSSVGSPEVVFDELRRHLGPSELVELVAATATYNMGARFVVALEIVPEL